MDGTDGIHGIMAWKLWENGVNHINRSDESKGFTDRFKGAVWTRRFWYDTMHWNGKKQIGGITVENCCNCHNQQSWKIFAGCVNFSWFFWEIWLGELATLWMIAINDTKAGIKIKEIDGTVRIEEKKWN